MLSQYEQNSVLTALHGAQIDENKAKGYWSAHAAAACLAKMILNKHILNTDHKKKERKKN